MERTESLPSRASIVRSIAFATFAVVASFVLFWPGSGYDSSVSSHVDITHAHSEQAAQPVHAIRRELNLLKKPLKKLKLSLQQQLKQMEKADAQEAHFTHSTTETLPITVNQTQRDVLTALKKAWGNFYKSDTWSTTSEEQFWWGVSVDELGSVTAIDLPSSQLTGSLPAVLSKLTALTILDIRGNNLRGSIPKGLFGALPLLQELYLSENHLTGTVPWTELFQRPSLALRMFHIDGNTFTGEIPQDTFATATALQSILLAKNQFSGRIPSSLGNCKLISAIELGANQFTGEIPGGLSGLPALSVFAVSGNKLTGNLPEFFGNLASMGNLDLSFNQFSGTVPASFSKFGLSLNALNLANNFLSGPLPAFPNLADACVGASVEEIDVPECYIFSVTLDLSNNYFTKSTVMTLQMSESEEFPATSRVCPGDYSDRLMVTGNCLTSEILPSPEGEWECPAQKQRPAAACTVFCGAGSPAGACGGNGVCFRDATSKFVCKCNAGFKQGATKQTCIAA